MLCIIDPCSVGGLVQNQDVRVSAALTMILVLSAPCSARLHRTSDRRNPHEAKKSVHYRPRLKNITFLVLAIFCHTGRILAAQERTGVAQKEKFGETSPCSNNHGLSVYTSDHIWSVLCQVCHIGLMLVFFSDTECHSFNLSPFYHDTCTGTRCVVK